MFDRSPSPLDREQIAHIEVGHTNVTRGTARATVLAFLILMVLLPAVERMGSRNRAEPSAWSELASVPAAISDGFAQPQPGEPATSRWERLLAGNRAVLARLTAFESGLEDQSAVGRLLRPRTQALLTAIGAGNERVYIGRDNWLFYRPDVDHVTGRGFLDPRAHDLRRASAAEFERVPQPDPLPAILRFHHDLQQSGIALVVLPTPAKPTVHPDRLSPPFAGPVAAPLRNTSFVAFVETLRRSGVHVFDPAPDLVEIARDTGQPQYLATDTHWRPEAVRRTASALAQLIAREITLPAVAQPGYRIEAREVRHVGDTATMLDLPPGQQRFPGERVDLGFVVDDAGEPWRASRDADVLVLGDSFSNIYSLPSMGWGEAAGFVEHLSVALQRPLDRITQNDDGAYATREALARDLSGATPRLTGKRLVIWQFAVRELSFGDWRVIELR
jgi:alginate O-acetyltransferase complex protein AlgJ